MKLQKELASFVGARFLTLLAENALLWLSIDILDAAPVPAKLSVSIITILGNYILCKYWIFKKEAVCHE